MRARARVCVCELECVCVCVCVNTQLIFSLFFSYRGQFKFDLNLIKIFKNQTLMSFWEISKTSYEFECLRSNILEITP